MLPANSALYVSASSYKNSISGHSVMLWNKWKSYHCKDHGFYINNLIMGRLPFFIHSLSYWGVWIFIFAMVIWDGLCSYKIIYLITIIWCIPPMLKNVRPRPSYVQWTPMIMHVSVTKGVIVISFTINFYWAKW